MAPTLLLRSADFEVVRDGESIEVRKRMGPLALVAALVWAGAAVFWFVGGLLEARQLGALGLFMRGAAGLIAFFGAVTLIGGLAMALSPKLRITYRIDGAHHVFSTRSRTVPLASVGFVGPEPFVGSFWGLFLTVEGTRTLLFTLHEARKVELQRVGAEVASLLKSPSTLAPPEAVLNTHADTVREQLASQILLIMGVAWSVLGYFLFRGLYFTSTSASGPQIPVWTAGLLFIGIGGWRMWRQRRNRS